MAGCRFGTGQDGRPALRPRPMQPAPYRHTSSCVGRTAVAHGTAQTCGIALSAGQAILAAQGSWQVKAVGATGAPGCCRMALCLSPLSRVVRWQTFRVARTRPRVRTPAHPLRTSSSQDMGEPKLGASARLGRPRERVVRFRLSTRSLFPPCRAIPHRRNLPVDVRQSVPRQPARCEATYRRHCPHPLCQAPFQRAPAMQVTSTKWGSAEALAISCLFRTVRTRRRTFGSHSSRPAPMSAHMSQGRPASSASRVRARAHRCEPPASLPANLAPRGSAKPKPDASAKLGQREGALALAPPPPVANLLPASAPNPGIITACWQKRCHRSGPLRNVEAGSAAALGGLCHVALPPLPETTHKPNLPGALHPGIGRSPPV